MDRRTIGLMFVIVGIVGLLAFPLYSGLAWYNSATAVGVGNPWNSGMMKQRAPRGSGQISLDKAVAFFQDYVNATGNGELALMEVMEFQSNFYAIAYEKSTGTGAFELLIDKAGGSSYGMMRGMMGHHGLVHPEPGPSMMWNTKYEMMMGMMDSRGVISINPSASAKIPITPKQAREYAAAYVNKNISGATLEDPIQFYGYYTIHILRDGKVYGMLSVNGYTGEVWYHNWHGYFMQDKDLS